MDILGVRIELQRMCQGDLFALALNRRISKCLIGGRLCGFYLQYEGSSFCVSELLGKGCQVESLEQLERSSPEKEGVNFPFPFLQTVEPELLSPRKKTAEFKVCHRDHLTRSIVVLGKIIERRMKERKDNLKDLLSKAMRQYSDRVEDPSTIFLLGS